MKSLAKPIEPKPDIGIVAAGSCGTRLASGSQARWSCCSGRLRLTTTPVRTRRAALATRSGEVVQRPRSSCAPQRPQLRTRVEQRRELRRGHVDGSLGAPASTRAGSTRPVAPGAAGVHAQRLAGRNRRCSEQRERAAASIIAMFAPRTPSAEATSTARRRRPRRRGRRPPGSWSPRWRRRRPCSPASRRRACPPTPAANATRIVSASTCCCGCEPDLVKGEFAR